MPLSGSVRSSSSPSGWLTSCRRRIGSRNPAGGGGWGARASALRPRSVCGRWCPYPLLSGDAAWRGAGETVSPTRERLARMAWRSLVGYALYAVAALTVFLVVSFPYDRLQVAMVAALAGQAHSRITVDDGRFVLPLGLRWRGVRIDPLGWGDRSLTVDSLRVRVAL